MKKDLRELFVDVKFNMRGNHIITTCPFCGKQEHLYLNVKKAFEKIDGEYLGTWDCKHCNESGNLPRLLEQLGREDFLEDESIDKSTKLKKIEEGEIEFEESEAKESKEIKLPVGFKRIFGNDYLEGRGWTEEHFRLYPVGYTDLMFKYKNYLIFSIEESNICRGFQARSLLTKEEIKHINKIRDADKIKKKYLRWVNSDYTNFAELVGGYDELNFGTTAIIGVEGLFDKVVVDNYLNLLFQDSMKCIFTFGKSIKETQIIKIKKRAPNCHTFILIQDPDAVSESKRYSIDLKKYFPTVLVGYTGYKDLGDSNRKEIGMVFEKLETPVSYNINKVQIKELL